MRIEDLRRQLHQFPDFDGFWQDTDLTVVETNIRKSLALAPNSIEGLTQLARILDLCEKPVEAEEILSQARKLFLQNKDLESKRTETRLRLEEGRHLCLAMTPNRAANLFGEAWNLATSTQDDYFAIEAAVLLSFCVPPKDQFNWLKRATSVAENTNDDRAKLWLTHIYILLGWHSFDLRQYEEAFKYFNLANSQPALPAVRVDLVMLRWALGRTLRALQRIEEALEVQKLLLGLTTSNFARGHIYLELAECYQLLQKYDETKEYFEKAHAELSQDLWFADNKADELLRMKDLGNKRRRF